jgi:hypothetical protein
VRDEFRVEVELDDEEHRFSLRERLRAVDLGDQARRGVGGNILVTRDGSRLFLYAASEAQAREAESVVRGLLSDEALSGEIAVTRWHPIEEEWKDASIALPATPEERQIEYARREAAEAREAELEGEFDWHVVAHVPSRDEAAALADWLAAQEVAVARRWKYVVAGELTEERAEELARLVRAEAPAGTEVRVEVNLADLPMPRFLFLSL